MKKRILSLALTLCLLAGLLPCLTVGAAAAAPYASVEYAKNADVKTGTVRYVCQVPAYSDLFCSDYWGSYGNYANHECFTACISMALSYLGLDATPGALGDYWLSCGHYGTPFATTPPSAARRTARSRSPRPSRATSTARAATARRSSTSTTTRPTATMS